MKPLLILGAIVIVSGCSRDIPEEQVDYRNDIAYSKENNEAITGRIIKTYNNGNPQAVFQYKKGKRYGLSEEFHENGQLKSKGNWKDGKRVDGRWEELWPNGQLKAWGNYKKGKREGRWNVQKREWESVLVGNYREGKREGLWEGTRGEHTKKVHFKNGKKDGLFEAFIKGKLTLKGNYINGKKVGLWEIYSKTGEVTHKSIYKKDGQVESVNFYSNGKIESKGFSEVINETNERMVGQWEFFYENGQLKEIGHVKEGRLNGRWKYFNEDGSLDKIINYKDGKPGKTESYENGELDSTFFPDSRTELISLSDYIEKIQTDPSSDKGDTNVFLYIAQRCAGAFATIAQLTQDEAHATRSGNFMLAATGANLLKSEVRQEKKEFEELMMEQKKKAFALKDIYHSYLSGNPENDLFKSDMAFCYQSIPEYKEFVEEVGLSWQ